MYMIFVQVADKSLVKFICQSYCRLKFRSSAVPPSSSLILAEIDLHPEQHVIQHVFQLNRNDVELEFNIFSMNLIFDWIDVGKYF